MSAKIIRPDFKQNADDRHTVGALVCEVCDHREPVVVAPCGRKHFECAKCHRMSAVREAPVLPLDGVMRQVCPTCTGQTFSVMRDAIMCAECGTVSKEDWSGAA